jgi:hypothetical protein
MGVTLEETARNKKKYLRKYLVECQPKATSNLEERTAGTECKP